MIIEAKLDSMANTKSVSVEYEKNEHTVDNNNCSLTTKNMVSTNSKIDSDQNKLQIVWHNVIWYIILHSIAIYGLYIGSSGRIYFKTTVCTLFLSSCSNLGITAGAHRLWSHHSYAARLPVQILLAVLQTLAGQNTIYDWVRNHRHHHKYLDTNGDPHNATRGFFFSHIGWLLVRKHPMAKSWVEMKDLEADPVVMFQKKYYFLLMPIITFLLPTLIPYWLWHEDLWYSFIAVGITRYLISLHITWLVNSAAHILGTRPYDKTITPVQSPLVSFLALGEGWHNYHHSFPWDYKAAELGNYCLNLTTMFIDTCALFGLTYDLKTTKSSTVERRLQRKGDAKFKKMKSYNLFF